MFGGLDPVKHSPQLDGILDDRFMLIPDHMMPICHMPVSHWQRTTVILFSPTHFQCWVYVAEGQYFRWGAHLLQFTSLNPISSGEAV
jgi:hypothetical protein